MPRKKAPHKAAYARKKAAKKAAANESAPGEGDDEGAEDDGGDEGDEGEAAPEYRIAPGRSITCSNRIIVAGQAVELRDLNDDPELAQAAMDQLVERGLVEKG